MNRSERRAAERHRQRRIAQVKQDMKLARERDKRYRYMIFHNNVPAWPDDFKTAEQAVRLVKKLQATMYRENPDDERINGFEVRAVLPSKAT